METPQIMQILMNDSFTKGVFRGVFPLDGILPPEKYPSAYVFNTDPRGQPGEHWIAIYLTFDQKGEYFDSYGLPPLQHQFLSFLKKHSLTWAYNDITVQSLTSDVCGEYCIFYLLQRCRGHSLNTIVNMFSRTHTEDNDFLVSDYILNSYDV